MLPAHHYEAAALLVDEEAQGRDELAGQFVGGHVVKHDHLCGAQHAHVERGEVADLLHLKPLRTHRSVHRIILIRGHQQDARSGLHLDPLGGGVVARQGILLGQESGLHLPGSRLSDAVC